MEIYSVYIVCTYDMRIKRVLTAQDDWIFDIFTNVSNYVIIKSSLKDLVFHFYYFYVKLRNYR